MQKAPSSYVYENDLITIKMDYTPIEKLSVKIVLIAISKKTRL